MVEMSSDALSRYRLILAVFCTTLYNFIASESEHRSMHSRRWEEFGRMADNMRNLSSSMLEQTHSNRNVDKNKFNFEPDII